MAKPPDKAPIYFGEFRHALDPKNRVTIPARWRSENCDELFIIRNPKRACLTVMPEEVFQRIGDEAITRAGSLAEHRRFVTRFYSSAVNVPIDKQGRMLVPE